MTTANLSLHSQKTNFGEVAGDTGQVYAGILADAEFSSALRFAPPADIAGATITSVTLTVRALQFETVGGVLVRFGLANNTDDLAAQNLETATATAYDHLHTSTFTGSANEPAGSTEISSTFASYDLDLTASANVANLEDDIIVLVQFAEFYRFTSGSNEEYIRFDGVGDTTPASLEIVYTPVVSGIALGTAGETDAALGLTIVSPRSYTLGIASEIDSGLTLTAPKSVTIGIAASSESGIGLSIEKAVSLGIAAEADAGLNLTVNQSQTIELGIASETDSGLSVTIQKDQTISLGIASEVDAALSVIATVPQTISLGTASETDAGLDLSITFGQIVALGIASENDAGLALTIKQNNLVTLGIARETDSALPITFSISSGGLLRQFFNHLAG